MGKINGKFAPLTSELGNDERFIIKSTDLDKLLYVLIVYTCHMTNHQAPIDPKFYKIRYGLRSKTGQIAASLRRLADLYPKLSWGDKKLSLLNSPTYKIQNRLEVEEEVEEEVDIYIPVINYLNQKTGKNFSSRSKANIRHIAARMAEGRTFDDFKKVIDKKVQNWAGTEMDKYLRPETLFNATKFESYLNERESNEERNARILAQLSK